MQMEEYDQYHVYDGKNIIALRIIVNPLNGNRHKTMSISGKIIIYKII